MPRFRVWPDGTVQEAEATPYGWMSDDYWVGDADDEDDAITRALGLVVYRGAPQSSQQGATMKPNDIHVIDFNPDGSVEAMCREDVIDLKMLGPQSITRASDIRYVDGSGWAIWLADPDDPIKFLPPTTPSQCGFRTYDAARRVEVSWLEYCRLQGIDPRSLSASHGLSELLKDNADHTPSVLP